MVGISNNYISLIEEHIRLYRTYGREEAARLGHILSLSSSLGCQDDVLKLLTKGGMFNSDELASLTIECTENFHFSFTNGIDAHPLSKFFLALKTPTGRKYWTSIQEALTTYKFFVILHNFTKGPDVNDLNFLPKGYVHDDELIKQYPVLYLTNHQLSKLDLNNLQRVPGIHPVRGTYIQMSDDDFNILKTKTKEDIFKEYLNILEDFKFALSSILPSNLSLEERRNNICSIYLKTPFMFLYKIALEDLTPTELEFLNKSSPTGKKIAWYSNTGQILTRGVPFNIKNFVMNFIQDPKFLSAK
jgi:hypothetical protein